ncbi:hypothetical protein VP01_11355g1, partial [Puccinia sorghi]
LINFVKLKLSFNLSNPFKPFEKLMGLMIGFESPIFELYPLRDSKMDLNGKNFDSEAIFKIPFTYQEIILESMKVHIGKFNPLSWEVTPQH